MSKGSHDCRKHCRGCGHIVDLVAGECPVCEYVHYVDEKKNDVEPQQIDWNDVEETVDTEIQELIKEKGFAYVYMGTFG